MKIATTLTGSKQGSGDQILGPTIVLSIAMFVNQNTSECK